MVEQDINLDFDNTEIGFSYKSDKELTRSYWLFRIMNNNLVVAINNSLALLAFKLRLPITPLLKATVFKQFCGGESLDEADNTFKKLNTFNIGSMVGYAVEAKKTNIDFDNTKEERLKIISLATVNSSIPLIAIKFTGLVRFELLEKIQSQNSLSPEEKEEFELVKQRLNEICQVASEQNIIINIDAEESWIQDPIDELVDEMMMKFNKEQVVVQNTIQLYRTDRLDYLKRSYEKARANHYLLGIKLVRGAYMEKERARAKANGYPSPIQPDKMATDRDYDLAIDFCISNVAHISFNAATHNEKSSYRVAELIEEKGLRKDHHHILFSQLYGMSDNISYNLANFGFTICKYIPYGPVRELIPFLIRRARENTSVVGQMSRELTLLEQEIKRRKLK